MLWGADSITLIEWMDVAGHELKVVFKRVCFITLTVS